MKARTAAELNLIFEEASEEVLQTTNCDMASEISNGWCEHWARAVKKRLPGTEIRQSHGHHYIVHDGVGYDSDKYEGFEPF